MSLRVWSSVVLLAAGLCPALTEAAEHVGCYVYATEDISNQTYKRSCIFVATQSDHIGHAVSLGVTLATSTAMETFTDYVVVYVTRMEDGIDRDEHNAQTALATVSFNPGGTRVIRSRLESRVPVESVVGSTLDDLLVAKRKRLSVPETVSLDLDRKEAGVTYSCAS